MGPDLSLGADQLYRGNSKLSSCYSGIIGISEANGRGATPGHDTGASSGGVDECRLQHGSQTRPRFRDDSNNTRTTVAEFPEQEFSVFFSLPKEWEAKAVLCKYSAVGCVCSGK